MPTTGCFKLHRTWCTKRVLKREITGRMPPACFQTTLTCWGIGEGWCHCVLVSFFFHQPLHLNYGFISPPPSSLFRSSPSPPPPPTPRSTSPRFVGPYTTLSPELSFVVEDSKGVCGYVLATLDSAEFYDRFVEDWLPSVINKYPKPPSSTMQSDPEQVSRGLVNNRPYLTKI